MPEIRHDLTRTTLAVLCIGGLIAASFLVVRPFLGALVWATTLVIATWPLMLKLQAAVGGRRGLAVTLMTIGLLLIVVLPLSAAIGAIVINADRIMALIVAVPDFHVPSAPAWLADIPLVGATAVERWAKVAGRDAAEIVRLATPYVGTVTRWFVGAAGSAGGMVLHLLLTIALAAVLYAAASAAGWQAHAAKTSSCWLARRSAAWRWASWSPPSCSRWSPVRASPSPACRAPAS